MSKSLVVRYNPINKNNTFTSGDWITGQITLDFDKGCKIDSVWVKLKGKAEVKWTEHYGKTVVTYYAKEKYFSIKQVVIEESKGNNIVGQGCHVYPFTFQIPAHDVPPSFKGKFGKVVYSLEANLSRSMRLDCKAKEKFTLTHNKNLYSDPVLKSPQQGIVEKKMNLFSSGEVSMDANVDRTGFYQGEGIKVVASIYNKTSREIRPKFCLYMKCSNFAKGRRKVETKDILKEVGDAIPPSAGQTVTRIITIPPDTAVSILNCTILKVEYRLKVYLDVKYAKDPVIKLPIVILPASQGDDGEILSAHSPYGPEAFPSPYAPGGTSFAQDPTAQGPFAPPPPYGAYGMYPPLNDFNQKS